MKTALAIIEEIYDMALNPELDYYAQLEPLATNGELANHNSSLKVLFKLCMLIDEQEKQIKILKEKNVDNIKATVFNEVAPNASQPIVTDPMKPLDPIVSPDEPITQISGSNTDTIV